MEHYNWFFEHYNTEYIVTQIICVGVANTNAVNLIRSILIQAWYELNNDDSSDPYNFNLFHITPYKKAVKEGKCYGTISSLAESTARMDGEPKKVIGNFRKRVKDEEVAELTLVK